MQKVKLLMRKTGVRFATTSILIFAVLLGGYYFFFLKPRLALVGAYEAAQKTLIEHRTALLRNRIALIGITRVNPSAPSAAVETADLTTLAYNSNSKAQTVTQQLFETRSIHGAPTALLHFITNDIPLAVFSLQESGKEVLEQQKPIIDSLLAADRIIGNVLVLNPDLLQFASLETESDNLIRQSDIAIESLNDTLRSLAQLREEHNIETTAFEEEIKLSQQHFSLFIDALRVQNFAEANTERTSLVNQLANLKVSAHDLLVSPLKSDSGVSLLTRQTNLILEYDFWLKKLRIRQTKLY